MKWITPLFLVIQMSAVFSQASFEFYPFATGLSEPVDIANAGDERLFIAEKSGRIQIVDARGNKNPVPFLDIDARVSSGTERGLLGLAFHPDYATNGYFFVNYTNNAGDTRISRFTRTSDPDIANPASEAILLTIDQPFANHNAGDLEFGPDGYLYVPLGDGGGAGDPGNRAQDPANLLGKILRLDVDAGPPFVPADNPFVADPLVADQIWAIGLRNPWRFSFDALTGDIWIGDVGQNDYEEVDFQPAGSAGGENYGWRCFEGAHFYNTSGCDPTGTYTFPVAEYGHSFSTGGFSITGGYVYRGEGNPNMYGNYLYCDYLTGNWWLAKQDSASAFNITPLGNLITGISSFGEDIEGELYVCKLDNGKIYKLVEDCSNYSRVTGLDAILLDSTTVSVSWDPLPNVNKYLIQGRKTGSATFISQKIAGTSVVIDGLKPGRNYEWSVTAKCIGGGASIPSNLSYFSTPTVKSFNNSASTLQVQIYSQSITINADEDYSWVLTDLTGRIISRGDGLAGPASIPLGALPAGIHLFSVSTNSGSRYLSKVYIP